MVDVIRMSFMDHCAMKCLETNARHPDQEVRVVPVTKHGYHVEIDGEISGGLMTAMDVQIALSFYARGLS